MSHVKISAREPGRTKQFTIWLTPEEYRAIRVLAAQRDTTLQSLVGQMIRQESARSAEPSAN